MQKDIIHAFLNEFHYPFCVVCVCFSSFLSLLRFLLPGKLEVLTAQLCVFIFSNNYTVILHDKNERK